uniref:Hydrolase n=1 Tax=virus sp. ctEfN2 TaxID=2825810 RepID=A0A8S5RMS6_9VIRU|nr:MAG TPA: hydrolase [virus sp. ctEfN2]
MALTAKKVYAILKRQISDMEAKIKTPIIYRGTVATADLLPLNPDIGDMYNIESKSVYGEAGMNVAWNSVAWDTMGAPIDMSLYIKSNELADWVKQQNKPTYTAEEVGALPDTTVIPSKTSELQNDSGFLTKIPDNYLSGTDKTLSVSGKAADAKAVGDKNVELLADISNKLNKNQGSENSGKIAGINESGDIVPMFPVSVDYNEETNCLEFGSDQKMELNKGIGLDSTLTKTGYAADAGVVGEITNSLKEDIGDKKVLYAIEYTWLDGKYINEYTARVDYTDSKIAYIADATPLIDKTIHVKTHGFGDMAYVVSDASWKRLLYGKSGNTSPVEEPWEFDITIPTNAKYIQISYSTRYPSIEFEMYEKKGTLFEMVKKIDDNLNEAPNENPLSVIRKDAGLLHVFRKVGCIGDSLSSGCCVFKNAQGIEQGADLYEFSWGQYLARMTGNTYYNFSRSGWSTRDWLTGDFGGNLAFDGNHACDCYFIGLGQNDNNQSIPVGTRADINLSDLAQNADTYYGNYGKIIQKIQARYPKAKIFIMTDPLDKASSPENNGYNDAVRTIATMFNNVYLMDLYRYGKEMYDYYGANLLSINKRYAHFNAVGYYLCALNIATYADWIMRKNPTEFLEVEFINTDMHYN